MKRKNALENEKLIKKKARQRELQKAEGERRKQAAERRLELQALRDRARMERTLERRQEESGDSGSMACIDELNQYGKN